MDRRARQENRCTAPVSTCEDVNVHESDVADGLCIDYERVTKKEEGADQMNEAQLLGDRTEL